jgi:HK97 family phage portal protein
MTGLIESFFSRNAISASTGAQPPPPTDDFWYTDTNGILVRVPPKTAMQVRAVYSCLRVLSESTGILPLITYRRTDGGKERATDHWLHKLLHDKPNDRQTPFDFQALIVNHLNVFGIFIAFKVPGENFGETDQLLPLDPERITIKQVSRGLAMPTLIYQYRLANGGQLLFTASELFVVNFMSVAGDGIKPIGVLEAASSSISLALQAQGHGDRYFRNDASSSVAIINKHAFKTAAERDTDREKFQESQTGVNKHKTMYIQGDADVKQLKVGHKDAQFLETRSFQVEEIAGYFRVPPHMIGHLARSTNNNIEEQGIQFARLDLMPFLVRIEQSVNRDLVTDEDMFAQFLVAALERGDIKTRYSAYDIAIKAGWLGRNEVRGFEGLNQRPELEGFLIPLNMELVGGVGDSGGSDATNTTNAQIIARQVKRLVSNEVVGIAKLAKKCGDDESAFNGALEVFYSKHANEVCATLYLPAHIAKFYTDHNLRMVQGGGVSALESRADEIERKLLFAIKETNDAAIEIGINAEQPAA